MFCFTEYDIVIITIVLTTAHQTKVFKLVLIAQKCLNAFIHSTQKDRPRLYVDRGKAIAITGVLQGVQLPHMLRLVFPCF